MSTVERRLVVTEEAGLHARPAAAFAQAAARAQAEVTVARADAGPDAEHVPAHSVLLVLTLGVRCGDEIVLRATGPDADAALDGLAAIAAPDGTGPDRTAGDGHGADGKYGRPAGT